MPRDDFDSRQVARIIDLLSEGIIEGFPSASGLTHGTEAYNVASLKDTFFNNTPVLGASAVVDSNSKLTDASIIEQTNFDVRNAVFESRLGSQDQTVLQNLDDVNQSTTVVNAELTKADIGDSEGNFFLYGGSTSRTDERVAAGATATPVTRQITDTDVTSIRVTIGSPAMTVAKDDGRVRGVTISYKIEIQYQGNGYNPVDFNSSAGAYKNYSSYLGDGEFVLSGYSPDLYQRRHLIVLDEAKIAAGTAFPVDIRCTRTGHEFHDDTVGITDDLIWYDFTQKIGSKTRYPNSALVGLKLNAEQFPSIPKRSYKIRGIKVRLPHHATVRSDGSVSYPDPSVTPFNGTLKTTREWTTDPAFILYDLLTNTRYGFGSQILTPEERRRKLDLTDGFDGAADIPENLDIYSFQKASAYCGELVDDFNGGEEPRFTCNVVLQTQEDAYKLIQELCSVFRAMPFWEAGGITVAQDAPDVFAYTFNQTNVTEAGFNYQGSSLRNRPTCVSVKFFDNDLRDFAQELVELHETDFRPVRKYGYNKQNITAFACTSRGQARRLGLWFLYSSHHETEVCSFETDIAAGITVRPGDLIKVSDPVRAGKTVSGRVIAGSTTTSVKLDRSDTQMFGAQAPTDFTLNVIVEGRNDDDSTKTNSRSGAKIYEVQAVAGSTIVGNTVTPGSTLHNAPVAGTPFSIGYQGLDLSLWRVLSVVENEATYEISAIAHEGDKYSVIEKEGFLFNPRDITQLGEKPDPVTNLQLQEILYEESGKVLQRLAINWQQSPRANEYEVEITFESNNTERHTVRTTGFDLLDSEVGVYEIRVIAIGYGLDVAQTGKRRSSPTVGTITTVGKTEPPGNIASLNISPIDAHTAELYWPQSTDLDVRIGGTVEIRHTPHTDANAVWGRAQDIVPAVNGSSTRKIVPLKEGTYLIRAKDSLGNYAAPAGIPSVVVDLPEPQDLELVQTYTENPTFGGTFTNMFLSDTENGVALVSDGQIDDITDFDDVTNIDFFGETVSSGEYQFASTLDLGAKYDVELLSVLQIRAFQPNDTWDERTALIDTWNDIDANDLSDTDVQVYVRSTNDDPSGTPTYGTWEPFVNNTKRGRGFQFKAESASSNVSQNPLIEQLGVKVSLQRRTEQQRNITSGTSAKSITFPSAFYSVPSVGITAQDFDSGDYFQLSSISRTGFTVTFKNSSDTIISKVFDYQAVGHGKEIT